MTYNKEAKDEIVRQVCERISNGESARSVFRSEGFPNRDTFYKWLKDCPTYADHYARACEDREELLFEDILHIADESGNDKKFVGDGDNMREVTDTEAIQRSKLRVEARKWALSKMNPKKYGDRINQAVTDGDGEPLSFKVKVVQGNPDLQK